MIETYMQMDNKVTCIVLMQLLYMYVASTHVHIVKLHLHMFIAVNHQMPRPKLKLL